MRIFKIILLCWFCQFFLGSCFAQKILVLKIPNKKKTSIIFHVNDDINLFIKGDEKKRFGKITEIKDTAFSVEGEVLSIGEIKMIVIYQHLLRIMQEVSAKAGVGFFMVDIFNRAINDDRPIFERRTFFISTGLVAYSLILTPFATKKYMLGKETTLRVEQ